VQVFVIYFRGSERSNYLSRSYDGCQLLSAISQKFRDYLETAKDKTFIRSVKSVDKYDFNDSFIYLLDIGKIFVCAFLLY